MSAWTVSQIALFMASFCLAKRTHATSSWISDSERPAPMDGGYFVHPIEDPRTAANIKAVDDGNALKFTEDLEIASKKYAGVTYELLAIAHERCNPKSSDQIGNYHLPPKQLIKLLESHRAWPVGVSASETAKAIAAARAGNGNAQFQCYGAWTKTGFGFHAHLYPGFGVDTCAQIAPSLGDCIRHPVTLQAGHLINAPPGGTELKAHIDGAPPAKLKSNLVAWLTENPSMTCADLAKVNGIQSLIHLDGARAPYDGATWTLAPLSPARLLLFLVVAETVEDEAGGFFSKKEGPFFFDDKKVIPLLNRAIKQCRDGSFAVLHPDLKFLQSIIQSDTLSATVEKVSMIHGSQSYAIGFIRGFPHGKYANKTRRLSLTVNCQLREPVTDPYNPRAKRAADIMLMTSGDEEAHKRICAYKPISSGSTHRNPKSVVSLMGPGRPFATLCHTPAQVELAFANS